MQGVRSYGTAYTKVHNKIFPGNKVTYYNTLCVTRIPNQTKVTNLSQGRLGESCKCECRVLGTAAPAPIVEVGPASILAASTPREMFPVDQIYTLILMQHVGTPI